MRLSERHVLPAQRVDPRVGRSDRRVRSVEQDALGFPHVRFREPPVVAAEQIAEIDDGVGGHAPGEVHVRIDVAERKRARRREDRLAAVQAGIARARHRSPSSAAPVDEDHVVELVDRLEAHGERRVAVLLENHRGGERGFQAVHRTFADHAAKAPQRGAPGRRLVVVGQPVQKRLHGLGRAQPADDLPLGCRERKIRPSVSGRHGDPPAGRRRSIRCRRRSSRAVPSDRSPRCAGCA